MIMPLNLTLADASNYKMNFHNAGLNPAEHALAHL